MLTVTPQATEWIKDQLKQAGAPDDLALRLFDSEGQIQMGVGEPKEGDQTYKEDDSVYLAVDPEAASKLQNKELCTQETAKGPSLAISAPAS